MAGGGGPVVVDEAEAGEVDGVDGEGGRAIGEAGALGVEASGGVVVGPVAGEIGGVWGFSVAGGGGALLLLLLLLQVVEGSPTVELNRARIYGMP